MTTATRDYLQSGLTLAAFPFRWGAGRKVSPIISTIQVRCGSGWRVLSVTKLRPDGDRGKAPFTHHVKPDIVSALIRAVPRDKGRVPPLRRPNLVSFR